MAQAIKATITESRDVIALLTQLPLELRGRIASKARRAAANIAARRARQLCPRSSETGTTELLSQATKTKRGNAKPLAETIRVADRERYSITVMGPEYPAGAHGHLVEFGHDGVYWGRPGERVPPKPFMRPAVDETMAQQQQVMMQVITEAVEEFVSGG